MVEQPTPPGAHGAARLARRRVLAWLLLVLALGLGAVAIAGSLLVGLDAAAVVASFLLTTCAIGLSSAPCGFLIARARPEHPVGWLFLGLGVAPLVTAATVPVSTYGFAAGWPPEVMRLLITVFTVAWPWGTMCCLPLALQLFPTGRPVSAAWRPLVWLTPVGAALYVLGTGPTPELGASSYLVPPAHEVFTAAARITSVTMLGSVASLVWRYRRGDDTVRRQLLWLVLAVVTVIAINLPWAFVNPHGPGILLILAFPLVPAAVTVAVLRHGLFDVRLAVSRALVYGLLTTGVVVGYLGLVAVLDRVLRSADTPVLAALAVALAVLPVRVVLQRAVRRALYGRGRDPVRAVSLVGERLAADDLTGVLEALRSTFQVPWAALRRGSDVVASAGARLGTPEQVVPLTFAGQRVGELAVGLRRGERRLPHADREVLQLLATPLAVAVRATALAAEVAASRARLVTAAEEERRRLYRDLHDSLGPVLTGAALTADAATLSARSHPDRAEQLAGEAAARVRQALDEVRRIVYGLRPPALDDLGLVGALRRQQGQLGNLALTVTATEPLPRLPAAVEVAAYRIASEAVTNAIRHTTASRAEVRVTADADVLEVAVTDDGGPSPAWSPGVGLESIAQRVAEVGGRAEAGPTPAGGRVVARLPLTVSAGQGAGR